MRAQKRARIVLDGVVMPEIARSPRPERVVPGVEGGRDVFIMRQNLLFLLFLVWGPVSGVYCNLHRGGGNGRQEDWRWGW